MGLKLLKITTALNIDIDRLLVAQNKHRLELERLEKRLILIEWHDNSLMEIIWKETEKYHH